MIKKEKYVITFLLTTLVFAVGIMIGSEITRSRTESIQKSLQADILESQSLEVELSILQALGNKEKCAYIESRIPEIVKKKVELGRKFDIGDVPEDDASLLDAQFVVSLGRYFVFNELQEKECGSQKPSVLFFKDESELSREQARVLDNLVFRMSDVNITVLTFSRKLIDERHIITLVYRLNNVTETPSIIVKGVKYEGFQPLGKTTAILCSAYGNEYTRPICKA